MKANDNIPEDEMLLAEAIAAAKARGLGWIRHAMYHDRDGCDFPVGRSARGWQMPRRAVTACCALGALVIAGRRRLDASFEAAITRGNDFDWHEAVMHSWDATDCAGESLGWAFRCAMTQDEP